MKRKVPRKEAVVPLTLGWYGGYRRDYGIGDHCVLCVAGLRSKVELPVPAPRRIWAVFTKTKRAQSFTVQWNGIKEYNGLMHPRAESLLLTCYRIGYRYVHIEYEETT